MTDGIARRGVLLGAAALALSSKLADPASARAKGPSIADIAHDLAPSGRLRVAINLGNPVLAQRDAQGALTGATVFLAEALAKRLKLPLDMIPITEAGLVFAALEKDGWDLAFLAVEPVRAAKIQFSQPYVYIDGTYMVRADSGYHHAADLDREGVVIGVGQGAAYDLYLTRTLKHAQLRRVPKSSGAVDIFLTDHLDAAAGIRQYLIDRARGDQTVRVIEDSFQRIEQAMGVPKGRDIAAAYLRGFVEEMKVSGQIRKALDATGQTAAIVAPPF